MGLNSLISPQRRIGRNDLSSANTAPLLLWVKKEVYWESLSSNSGRDCRMQFIIVILKDREILPYYTPFRPLLSSAKLMGHSCHMHVSELSSPAPHAATGAHSLGTGAHSAFYRALSACLNRLCTHDDTIESPNAFPYLQHCEALWFFIFSWETLILCVWILT